MKIFIGGLLSWISLEKDGPSLAVPSPWRRIVNVGDFLPPAKRRLGSRVATRINKMLGIFISGGKPAMGGVKVFGLIGFATARLLVYG
jgi:hypothetical protein